MTKNKTVWVLAALLLTSFMQILIPLPIPVPINYIFMGFGLLVAMMSLGEGYRLHWASVLFLSAMVISIVGNHIPAFFKPWERFALFTMLMVGCSPLLRGPAIDRVRRHLFLGAVWACVVVTMWSFVAYFTGTGLYIEGFVNGYMGVTGHPNFLGFFTMVAQVSLAALYFRCTTVRERVIVGGLWGACIIVLLVSASRSSTAFGLLGSVVAAWLRLQRDAAQRFRLVLVGVCAVLVATPYLMPYAETMMKKEMDFDDGGEAALAATRGSIWELRFQELAESPVIGIGAYSCDINLPNADIFYNEDNGNIELGSSYLGVLSQTGWLGFIALMCVVVPIVLKTARYALRERTPLAVWLLPLQVVCLLHMTFEGYLLTAGTVQSVVVWLLLAISDQVDTAADYPVMWEKTTPITPEAYVYWREHYAEKGDKL